MNLAHTSLRQLAAALRAKTLSSRELAQSYLDRIARMDPPT